MRIGVLGGTFDPVHVGHLIIAEQCREQARLDHVWFIPSARPPHKLDSDITRFDRRVEMLELALAGQPQFTVNQLEKDRPGPSYTADTLAELQVAHPQAELHLIIGADCLPDFSSWYEPRRIVERATLLVIARPGFPLWTAEQLAHSLSLSDQAQVRMQIVDVPLMEIASRDLRRRAAEGRSILYMVPRAVEVYIREKGLYQGT